jgi:hypothetical protein
MSIKVKCRKGHSLKVKERYAGRKIRCPACKSGVHIPVPEEEIPGGLVRGGLPPENVTFVWEFFDDPSDEIEYAQPESSQPLRQDLVSESYGVFGELVPVQGYDSIQLLKTTVSVGRRKPCDIVLNHRNVSSSHAELRFVDGYWFITDLKSTNGVSVNGKRVKQQQRLNSGDVISFATHEYMIKYERSKNAPIASSGSGQHAASYAP